MSKSLDNYKALFGTIETAWDELEEASRPPHAVGYAMLREGEYNRARINLAIAVQHAVYDQREIIHLALTMAKLGGHDLIEGALNDLLNELKKDYSNDG